MPKQIDTREIWVIAPVPRMHSRVRLGKFRRLYKKEGLPVSFAGWERSEEDSCSQLDADLNHHRVIHVGGGYSNRKLALHYPLWAARVFTFTIRARPVGMVHALGLETVVPVLLARMLLRLRFGVLFDDADRMSYSHSYPKWLLPLLRFIERGAARAADIHVVPGLTQYPDGLPCQSTVLLRNSPSEQDIESSMAVAVEAPNQDELVVYVNGWVGETRGAAVAFALASHFATEPRFRMIVAGDLRGHLATQLSELPNVLYLGRVSTVDALALYRSCNLCLAVYDPQIEINKHAGSNKWADCVRLGIPLIVNDETVTAHVFREAGACVSAPYSDHSMFIEEMERLLSNPSEIRRMSTAMTSLQGQFPSFDTCVKKDVIPLVRSSLNAPNVEPQTTGRG